MSTHYLNDAEGIKEARLTTVAVDNPVVLEAECATLLSARIVDVPPERIAFAQNTTTHLIQIAGLLREQDPAFCTVVMSDHEMLWMKEMFEIPGYVPDATYSNYRGMNDPVAIAAYAVRVLPFEGFADAIEESAEPQIFYVSHVSRLDGVTQDLEKVLKAVRLSHPESVLVVDGAQSLGVLPHVMIEDTADAYLGMSYKFLGAEPTVGIACFSKSFRERLKGTYPIWRAAEHGKDLYSLRTSLLHPGYAADYGTYIGALKAYAMRAIERVAPGRVYAPKHQATGFLALDVGNADRARAFVLFARERGVIVSSNVNAESVLRLDKVKPLVRVGFSVRATEDDMDALVEVVDAWERKQTS